MPLSLLRFAFLLILMLLALHSVSFGCGWLDESPLSDKLDDELVSPLACGAIELLLRMLRFDESLRLSICKKLVETNSKLVAPLQRKAIKSQNTFLLCVVMPDDCWVRDRFRIKSPVIMYASKPHFFFIAGSFACETVQLLETTLWLLPFAFGIWLILGTFGSAWPIFAPYFDVVCTGLRIIVGMRDGRLVLFAWCNCGDAKCGDVEYDCDRDDESQSE